MNYPNLSECKIGFIGAGNIALAIANGFVNSGMISSSQMYSSAPSDRNLIKFKDLGCFTTNDNKSLLNKLSENNDNFAKIIFLCVKPIIIKGRETQVFLNCNDFVSNSGPLIVISVLAGITIQDIRIACGFAPIDTKTSFDEKVRFARLMPNTACSINSGICGISREINDQQFDQFLNTLLSSLGLCEIVSESQMNAVCGLGGSGIAFVYSMIHAMSDGGLKMGLTRNVSTNFAAQTVLGAALMVLKTKRNAIELRDEVTSPSGTTIYGLHALERGSFNCTVIDAIESATKRANELS